MEKGIDKSPEYRTYTFDEKEFKEKLGISDDPAGILLVRVDFGTNKIQVMMSNSRRS